MSNNNGCIIVRLPGLTGRDGEEITNRFTGYGDGGLSAGLLRLLARQCKRSASSIETHDLFHALNVGEHVTFWWREAEGVVETVVHEPVGVALPHKGWHKGTAIWL